MDSPATHRHTFGELVRSDLGRLRPGARQGPVQVAARCLTMPDMLASVLVRAQYAAHARGIGVLARVLRTLALVLVGMDVTPGARLGRGAWIAHPSGVVIGNGVTIGDGVTIAGGVTLGSRNPGEEFGPQEYPTIGDYVVLGSHAVVLGGVRIGDRAVIAAHALVLEDVAADTTVAGVPARPVGSR